jgi:hypothetical protein
LTKNSVSYRILVTCIHMNTAQMVGRHPLSPVKDAHVRDTQNTHYNTIAAKNEYIMCIILWMKQEDSKRWDNKW